MAANPAPQLLDATQTDPLAELRDIHLPPAIDPWPPAPGWWILAGLAIALFAYGLYRLYKYWKSNAYRREAGRELDELLQQYQSEPRTYLLEYSTLLKRVALTKYPRTRVASLTGEAWVAFLDQTGATHEFSMGPGQALVEASYTPDAALQVDVASLHEIGKRWIKAHRPIPEVAA